MALGDELTNPQEPEQPVAGALPVIESTQKDQKSYYAKIKKRNKNLLLKGISKEEKRLIAEHIIDLYDDAKPEHDKLCDKIDEWDEVARLIRKQVIGSEGSELPNYRIPISLVAGEVIHSNIMNVFFSPKDIMRTLPTSADDISKVNHVSVFGNWSMKNELDLFKACDRLFHASGKNGESVAMLYWKKEYGVDVKRENMTDPKTGQAMYDEETKEPIYQEVEEPKLLYNAPFMEVISRKDYIQPKDCIMDQVPSWEGRIVRLTYDDYTKGQLLGKYFEDDEDEMSKEWPAESEKQVESTGYEGNSMMIGKWEKEFLEFYGRLRINVIKTEKDEQEEVEAYELEDEFIALVHIKTKTLCAIRKNRFPLKERPFIPDYFIPDDGGRRAAIGVYELMDSLQKAYDVLFNQFIYGVDLSNNPIVFFSPTGNMRDEKIKLQKGYMYPTSDPASVKLFEFTPPNAALQTAMELVQQWSQLLFGISDYAAGMESTIDPSAPAKKAEIVVEQGNVRLNMIIKRKNDVLKNIFKRWFLLYRDNMPPDKFMRISGEGENKDPWKFEPISYEDFALKSLPDFELTGNVLNANKQLEANKAIAIYQMLSTNIFFSPMTQQGLQALRSLTKWVIDKMDDAGLSRFLPEVQNEGILYTPEEENATMLAGMEVIPLQNEDHAKHLKSHLAYINDPQTPEEIKPIVGNHIKATLDMLRQAMTTQMVQQGMGGGMGGGMPGLGQPPQTGAPPKPGFAPGGKDELAGATGFGAPRAPQGMV